MDYLNQGLDEIATYRPDAFYRTIDQELSPGAKQEVSSNGTVDSVEVNGIPLTQSDMTTYKAFSSYAVCAPRVRVRGGKAEFRVRAVAVDPDRKGIFYVSPPVPAGLSLRAKINIVGEAPKYSLADWGKPLDMQNKYLNDLIDFILARAYQRDAESAISSTKSQRLFSIFYQRMGAKYKIDSAYNSGYFKGEMGTGDPRAVIT